jgi:hypothetical protein
MHIAANKITIDQNYTSMGEACRQMHKICKDSFMTHDVNSILSKTGNTLSYSKF